MSNTTDSTDDRQQITSSPLHLFTSLPFHPFTGNSVPLTTSSVTPSIRSTLWREVFPRIMATCRRAIPNCLAINSQHCLFASLSTGGLVSFMRSALLWMPAISQRDERGTTETVSSTHPDFIVRNSLSGCGVLDTLVFPQKLSAVSVQLEHCLTQKS
jgi:hypothetical protein